MSLLHNISYLQWYWIVQSIVHSILIAHTYLSGITKASYVKPASEKIGFFQFRKRRTTAVLIAVIWTIYMGYKTIGSYCFGFQQSQLVHSIGSSILVPRIVNTDSTSTLLALILFLIHSGRRLYEYLKICVFSHTNVQSLIGFVEDHLLYIAIGLSLIAESPLLEQQKACLALSSLRWQHPLAIVVFLWATRIQYNVQLYFPKLRRNKSGHIVTTQHRQPKDGWFSKLNISNPQYFAEILIFVSIGAVLGCCCKTWWLLTLYVFVNHLHLAIKNHRFYVEKFEDYPRDRNILVPYLL